MKLGPTMKLGATMKLIAIMNPCLSHRWMFSAMIAGLVLVISGCTVPKTRPANAIGSGPAPQSARMSPVAPQSMMAAGPPGAHQAAPYAASPMVAPMNSVAQVGHFIPAQLGAACGCGSCGTGECAATAPHGYVMQSPQGWNAYGIDPQEFLCDGGDRSPRATLRHDDSIAGLGSEDTVVHYTTDAGDIQFQASNRACVYAPRFTSVRKITGALAGGRAIGLGGVDLPVGPIRVEQDLPGLVIAESTELAHADVARRLDSMRERNRGVPVEGVLQLEQAADVMAALAALKLSNLGETQDSEIAVLEKLALAAVPWTIDESLEVVVEDLRTPTLTRDHRVEGLTIYEFPDGQGRLQVVKLADRSDALPGDTVVFAIRVDNVGDGPVNQVVLTDNLTTRLEYVADSQTCEGADAEFTAVANESQSLKLQWKISDELQVGDSVTIRFECKVR